MNNSSKNTEVNNQFDPIIEDSDSDGDGDINLANNKNYDKKEDFVNFLQLITISGCKKNITDEEFVNIFSCYLKAFGYEINISGMINFEEDLSETTENNLISIITSINKKYPEAIKKTFDGISDDLEKYVDEEAELLELEDQPNGYYTTTTDNSSGNNSTDHSSNEDTPDIKTSGALSDSSDNEQ